MPYQNAGARGYPVVQKYLSPFFALSAMSGRFTKTEILRCITIMGSAGKTLNRDTFTHPHSHATHTRTRGTATHTRKMDGSTIVFVLIMMCLFMYTLKRKNAKEAPTRTVRNTKPAATAATEKPSSEPLPVAEPVPEQRVTQSDAHDVSRKRPVNNDMVEIVMTMAPHVPQQKVVQDLRSTGSIERTMENIFAGKLD